MKNAKPSQQKFWPWFQRQRTTSTWDDFPLRWLKADLCLPFRRKGKQAWNLLRAGPEQLLTKYGIHNSLESIGQAYGHSPSHEGLMQFKNGKKSANTLCIGKVLHAFLWIWLNEPLKHIFTNVLINFIQLPFLMANCQWVNSIGTIRWLQHAYFAWMGGSLRLFSFKVVDRQLIYLLMETSQSFIQWVDLQFPCTSNKQ